MAQIPSHTEQERLDNEMSWQDDAELSPLRSSEMLASCQGKGKYMKMSLLSVLRECRTLTMVVLIFASLMVPGGAGNVYGQQFSTSSPAVMLSTRDSVVKQVQLGLRQRGYYAGAIDGFLGEKTQIGIQMYEVDHCHQTAPLITRWLLVSLGIGGEGKMVVGSRSS